MSAFDDLIPQNKDAGAFGDLIPQAPSNINLDAPVGSEGIGGGLADFGRGVAKGVISGLPTQLGQAAEFFGAPETGKALQEFGDRMEKEHPGLNQSIIGQRAHEESIFSPRGAASSAGENTPLSVGPGVAGAAAGAALGTLGGPVGMAAGAAGGYLVGSLAALPIFYGSQGQQSYEAIKKGLEKDHPEMSPEDIESQARTGGHLSGATEAGGELAADLIPFAKLTKPLAKPIAGSLVKSTLGGQVKKGLATMAEIQAGEVSTEVAQQAVENEIEKQYGSGGEGATWKNSFDVAMPTALMTLLPGGLTVAHNFHTAGKLKSALEDGDADAERRAAAASVVFHQIKDQNPIVAKAFDAYAAKQIEDEKPIEVADDKTYLDFYAKSLQEGEPAAPAPTPSQKAGIDPAAGPMSDAAATAMDTGLTQAVTEQRAAPIADANQAQQEEQIRTENPEMSDDEVNKKLAEYAQTEAQNPIESAIGGPVAAEEATTIKRAEAGKEAGETTQPLPPKMMPFATVEAARTAADALTKRTGDAYAAVPHPLQHDKFTVVPAGRAAEPSTKGQTIEGESKRVADEEPKAAEPKALPAAPKALPAPKEETSASSPEGQATPKTDGAIAPVGDHPENVPPAAEAEGGVRPPEVVGGPRIAPGTVDEGAHEGATSPTNTREEPTPDQKAAGNYKVGPMKVGPFNLSIENAEGSQRSNLDVNRLQKLHDTLPDEGLSGRGKKRLAEAIASAKAGDYETARTQAQEASNLVLAQHPVHSETLDRIDTESWATKMTAHYGYATGLPISKADKDRLDFFVKPGTDPEHTGPVYVIDQVKKDGSFDETKTMAGYGSKLEAIGAYKAHYPAGHVVGEVTEATPEQFIEWAKTGDTSKAFASSGKPTETPESKPEDASVTPTFEAKDGKLHTNAPEVTHVTQNGKTLTGVIWPAPSPFAARAIDRFTFRKDGGYFIRTDHIVRTDAKAEEPVAPPVVEPPVSPPVEPPTAGEPKTPKEPKPEPGPDKVTIAQAKKVWAEAPAEDREAFKDGEWRVLAGSPHVIADGEAYHFIRNDRTILFVEGFVSPEAKRRALGKPEVPSDATAEEIDANDGAALAKRIYEGSSHEPIPEEHPQILPDRIIRMQVPTKVQKPIEERLKKLGFRITDRSVPISDAALKDHVTISAIYRADKASLVDVGEKMAGQLKGQEPIDRGEPGDPNEAVAEKILASVAKSSLLDPERAHENGTFGAFMFREAFFNRIVQAAEFVGNPFKDWSTQNAPKKAIINAIGKGRIDEVIKTAQMYKDRLLKLMQVTEAPEKVADVATALRKAYLEENGTVTEAGRDLSRLMGSNNIARIIRELEQKYGPNEESTDQTNREVKKDPKVPPRLENIVRRGLPDYRGGKNVEAEDFKNTFGFRGVEFGNWVNQTERQENLNLAYDGLMDMAANLGVSPKAISLGGELGLAFGARGRSKAAAHFEPSNNVINLTKNNGNGTVSHEWMHALEHALRFGTAGNNGTAVTDGLRQALRTRLDIDGIERHVRSTLKGEAGTGGSNRNVPPKKSAIAYLIDRKFLGGFLGGVERGTDYHANAQSLDRDKGEAYWATPHEEVARGFESAMFDRLKGGSPYLTGPTVADGYQTKQNGYAGTPYPMGDERAYVEQVYRDFIANLDIEERKAKTYDAEMVVEKAADGRFVVHDQHFLNYTVFDKEADARTAAEARQGGKNALSPRDVQIGNAAKEALAISKRISAIMKELGLNEHPEIKNGSMSESMFYHLRNGWWPEDNAALKKFAAQAFETDVGNLDNLKLKQAQEDFEAALGKYAGQQATDLAATGANHRAIYDAMTALYAKQPNLDVRTSTSMINQGYSTPLPIGYVATLIARIKASTKVFEPTAGNGLLAAFANPQNVIANEKEAHRAQNLRLMEFGKVIEGDALTAEERKVFKKQEADVVVANPPFGVLPKEELVDGYHIKAIDQLIAARSLEAMRDDGRAVLILGANIKPGILSAKDTFFLNWLYSHYNVADHFEIDGKLYSRQGASWPLRVLVIAGRQASDKVGPASGTIERVYTFDQLWDRHVQAISASEQVLVGSVRQPGGAVGGDNRPGAVPPGGTGEAGKPDGKGGATEGAGGGKNDAGGLGGVDVNGRPSGPAAGPAGERPSGGNDLGGGPEPSGPGGPKGGGGRRGGTKGSDSGGLSGGGTGLENITPADIDALFGESSAAPKKGKAKTGGAGGVKKVKFKKGAAAEVVTDTPDVYTLPAESPDQYRDLASKVADLRPFFNELRIDPDDGRIQLDDDRTLRFVVFTVESRGQPLGQVKTLPTRTGQEFIELLGIEHRDGTFDRFEDAVYQTGVAQLAGPVARKAPGPRTDDLDAKISALLDGADFSLGVDPGFKQDLYAKMKPTFQEMWARFLAAASSAKAAMVMFRDHFLAQFKDKIVPYLKAFLTEVTQKVKETPTGKQPIVEVMAENDLQVPYIGASKGAGNGIYVPRAQALSVKAALDQLEAEVASEYPDGIDQFVSSELGYASPEEMFKGLGGYQVDAVGLAIRSMKRGDGFIIGDDTGVGKGRTAAALITWAKKNGKVPILLTYTPDLYSDMRRDLKAIGRGDTKIAMTNTDGKITDQDTKEVVQQNSVSSAKALIKHILDNGTLPNADVLFTTYPQLNVPNDRQRAIARLVGTGNAVLIMDESHNASGEDSNINTLMTSLFTPPQNAVDDWAPPPTVYLSATYAKRPANLPVYMRTHIRHIGTTAQDIADIVANGGNPLQQVVSEMLSESGQMIRRERSYANVKVDYSVDEDNSVRDGRLVDGVTDVLRSTVIADRSFKDWLDEDRNADDLISQLSPPGFVVGGQQKVTAGIDKNPFTSVVHNYISQMLLASKVDKAVENGIAALNRGEKPLFTLQNTLEAALNNYVSAAGISPGDDVPNYGWQAILNRALNNTLNVTIKNSLGDKVKVAVPLRLLPHHIQQEYAAAQKKVNSFKTTLTAAPIDAIREGMNKYHVYQQDGKNVYALPKDVPAGVTSRAVNVLEITGRNMHVTAANGTLRYQKRSDISNVQAVIGFNGGDIDGLIINSSGSTGISLHPSTTFTDQRPRRMFILQPSPDISVYKQILGRINRTGQVEYPLYTAMATAVPAEKRPLAMLRKKMKMLSSNTSAQGKTATDIETTDIINPYGDAVVAQYLRDHSEVRDFIGLTLPSNDENIPEDLALKTTGRVALLSVEDQKLFYEEIERAYKQEIDMRNQTGTNRLERRVLDLDAEALEESVFIEGDDNSKPFLSDAFLTKYSVNVLGEPPTPGSVKKEIEESLAGRTPQAVADQIESELKLVYEEARNQKVLRIAELAAEMVRPDATKGEIADAEKRKKGVEKELQDFAERKEKTLAQLSRTWAIGSGGIVRYGDLESYGTVVGIAVHKAASKAGNPYAPSNFVINIMRNIPNGRLPLPLSRIEKMTELRGPSWGRNPDFDWEYRDKEGNAGREDVHIITGNLPVALGQLQGKPEIITFTTKGGEEKTGILLPRSFDPGNLAQQDYNVRDPQAAANYLLAVAHELIKTRMEQGRRWLAETEAKIAEVRGQTGGTPKLTADAHNYALFAKNRVVQLVVDSDGEIELVVDKSLGGRWVKNKTVMDLVGDLSGRRGGSYMRATVPYNKVLPLVRFLRGQMPLYVQNSIADTARPFVAAQQPAAMSLAPAMKAGRASAGMTRTQVAAAIAPIIKGWKNSPKIAIYETAAQLPFRAPERAQGALWNGKVYLVAANLRDARDAQLVMLHEIAGHYGLQGILGDQLTGIMERIYATNADIKAQADERKGEYARKGVALSTAKAVEEILADRAAKQKLDGVSGWKFLVAAIRSALRKLGFNLATSDEDITALLAAAGKYMESGVKAPLPSSLTAANDGPMFSLRTDGLVGAAIQEIYDRTNSAAQFNWLHRRVATQFHKAQINPEFRPVFQGTQRYIQDTSMFAHQAADEAGEEMLPRLGRVRDVFRNITKTGQINRDVQAAGKAVWAATLADVRPTQEQLTQGFTVTAKDEAGIIGDITVPPLSAGALRQYNRARAAIDTALDQAAVSEMAKIAKNLNIDDTIKAAKDDSVNGYSLITTALHERAAQARIDGDDETGRRLENVIRQLDEAQARVQQLKDEGYAPLMRFGQYTVKVTEVRNGMSPTTLYFGMFESKRDANRMEREMRQQYPDATTTLGTMDEESWKLYRGLSLDSLHAFAQATGLQSFEPVQDFLRLATSSRSAMKRLIHRKGVEGYDEDLRRVLAGFITSQARLSSRNYNFGAMTEAHAAIPDEHGDVKAEAAKLIQYVQNPIDEATAIRGMLFVNFIGGSVASALVNLTQPVMMTLPYLSQFGGPGRASKAMKDALGVAGGGVSTDAELNEAMDRAAKQGITEPQELHQLYAESIRGMGSNIWWRKGLRVWGSMFSVAESFNRRITFAAAFQLAQQPGALQEINRVRTERNLPGFDNAFDFAESSVEDTQGIYNRGNRPNWGRGALGATLFTFKQFTIAYLEFLTRLPAREKAIALSLLVLASGLQGAPGADDLENLLDTIGQMMGFNTNSKKVLREQAVKTLGESLGGFLTHGISGIPGVPLDVQGRLGIHQLIPLSGIFKRSEVDKGAEIADAIGPLGGLYTQAQKAANALEAGQYGQFLSQGTPVAIQNALKGFDMWQSGEYKDSRGRKVINTDKADAALKAIGLQPQDVAMAQRKASDVRQDVDMVRTVESAISDKWARGLIDHDDDAVKAAIKQLFAWNTANPQSIIAIDPRQIRQRIQAAMLERDVRTIKSAPREVRAGVIQSLRPGP